MNILIIILLVIIVLILLDIFKTPKFVEMINKKDKIKPTNVTEHLKRNLNNPEFKKTYEDSRKMFYKEQKIKELLFDLYYSEMNDTLRNNYDENEEIRIEETLEKILEILEK